jgi:hypothetical protein
LICFDSALYISFLNIGTKILKQRMARITAVKMVKRPLVAEVYESLLVKYKGVRYSTREMYLKPARTRFQKVFFFSALEDLISIVAEIPPS